MSEEAKPACVQCGVVIGGRAYDYGDGPQHFCTITCTRAERDYLRAALDQERAKGEMLRALVYDAFMEGWYRHAGYTDRRIADFGREWEQYSKTPASTALLSGRGDGSETK